jgi:hypothetical protein
MEKNHIPKIDLVSFYHPDFIKTRNSIKEYSKKWGINLIEFEVDSSISYSDFVNIAAKSLCSQMLISKSEYTFLLAPFSKIKNQEISPNVILSLLENDSCLFFSNGFTDKDSISFASLALRNTKENISSLMEVINTSFSLTPGHVNMDSYSAERKIISNKVKDIFMKHKSKIVFSQNGNRKVIFKEQYDSSPENISHFGDKSQFLIESYFEDKLSYDSRYVNLELEVDMNIKSVDKSKHYSDELCIISLYTKEIETQGLISSASIADYCNRHKISYEIFDKKFLENYAGNWSKTFYIAEKLRNYKAVMFLDADVIITNPKYDIRNLISSLPQNSIFCKDPALGWNFNSGAMIFKNCHETLLTLNMINAEITMTGEKKWVYDAGGDQEYIIRAVIKNLENGRGYIILPDTVFNSHPVKWRDGDFLMHLMGYGGSFRDKYMKYLLDKYTDLE